MELVTACQKIILGIAVLRGSLKIMKVLGAGVRGVGSCWVLGFGDKE